MVATSFDVALGQFNASQHQGKRQDVGPADRHRGTEDAGYRAWLEGERSVLPAVELTGV